MAIPRFLFAKEYFAARVAVAAAAHVLPAAGHLRVPDVPAVPASVARAHNLPVGRDGLETDGSEDVA